MRESTVETQGMFSRLPEIAKCYYPMISDFCDRLLSNKERPIAGGGDSHGKALHLAFGMLKSGKSFAPKF